MSLDSVVPPPAHATRRRWPRYKLDVPLRVIRHDESKVTITQGRGAELNQGGMAVMAWTELAIDERVSVEFTPPYTGEPIRVRCTVRNRKGYRYGVEFVTENADDSKSVAKIAGALRSMGLPAE